MLYINNEPITAENFIKKFGLRDYLPKGKDYIVFEQLQVRKDRATGRMVYPQLNENKFYSLTTPEGETMEIRQSTTPPRYDSKSGDYVFADRKHYIDSHAFRVSLKKNLELALFFLLNPNNVDSPYAEYNADAYKRLKVQDLEKAAKANNERILTLKKCFDAIYDEDVSLDSLRQKASGLGIPKTFEKGKGELQSELAAKANANPIEFHAKWYTQDTEFKGIIQVAKDKGLIYRTVINGTARWFLQNDEICIVRANTDEADELNAAIVANFNTWMRKIENAVKGTNVDGKIGELMSEYTKDAEQSKKELVARCVEANVLYFDLGEKAVYKMKNGEKSDKVIDVKDIDKWMSELVEYYEQDNNGKSLNGLALAASKKLKKANADT